MCPRCFTFALIIAVLSAAMGTSEPARTAGTGATGTQVRITGRVVDAQVRPVAGARVTLYEIVSGATESLSEAEVVEEKTTGANGEYILSSSPMGRPSRGQFLLARKEGLALGWAQWSRQAEQRSDIVLGEARELAGDVVDEQGRPLAEAEVGIVFATMRQGEEGRILTAPTLLTATTDNRGHFVFANMPAAATFEFLVRKPGRVTLNTFLPTFLGDTRMGSRLLSIVSGQGKCQFAPGQEGIRLILPPAAAVDGLVVEKTSGKPLAGVRVRAQSDQPERGFAPPDPVTTAADGTFHLGGLAAGDHTVQLATASGQTAEWVADPVPVSLRAGETKAGIKLELAKGAIIEVLARDSEGKPVPQAYVRASDTESKQSFRGNTDANGLARIRVMPGQYQVSEPSRPGYALQFRRQQVAVGAGEIKRVEFVLGVRPRIAGTVRDEAGHPLAGVWVAVTPVTSIGTQTNAKGEFVLDWNVRLSVFQDAPSLLVARDLTRNLAEIAEIHEQTGRIDLQLKPAVTLTGTVLTADGKPLAGARVLVSLQSAQRSTPRGLIEGAATGENGAFEIKALPPGRRYELMATAAGYAMEHVAIEVSDVNDNHRDIGELRLPLADRSISGVIVDGQGKPVPGATIAVVDGSLPPREDIQTAADGTFTIRGVPAGSILLMASTREPKSMHGSVEADGGATGVRIVLSE